MFLWIDRYRPLFTLCTEIQKSVVRCQGGPWISGVSLWIKQVVIHRGVFTQVLGPVINWAQGRLFTGLNPQKSVNRDKSRAQKSRRNLRDIEKRQLNALKRAEQTGTNGLSVD